MDGKLVRDKIPEIIRADGIESEIEILSNEAYGRALDAKLIEEANEVGIAQTPEQKLAELADLEEVKLARLQTLGYTQDDLERVRTKKVAERGAFAAQIFLKQSTE